MAICFANMTAFNVDNRLEWQIWGARAFTCNECKAEPGKPCVSLADLRNRDSWRQLNPKPNKWPHSGRIDWNRVLNGLKQRGYYSPIIEDQVRRMVDE